MSKESQLADDLFLAIKRVTRGAVVVEGTIVSVDESAFTCDVSINVGNDTPETHFDVPLRVLVNNQASVVEIPEINSECLLCFRDSNIGRPQILTVQKALKILVLCNDIQISSDKVVFNNGTLGGMVKLNDLVSKLNTLESDINTLKAAFSAWVVAPGDGGAALKTATGAWYGHQLQPTQPADLENPKIKQ
jgi:hypothetical protein